MSIWPNILKVVLIFSLCLVNIINGFTQGKCNLTIQSDEFTGARVISSKLYTIMDVSPPLLDVLKIHDQNPWSLSVGFIVRNDSVMVLTSHLRKLSAYYVGEISFKFEDGEVYKLTNGMPGHSIYRNSFEVNFTYFNISKEDLNIFSSKSLTKARVIFASRSIVPYDKDIKPKIAQSLSHSASCIIKEI